MGPNRPTKQPATHHPIQGNVVAVSTKANFRRPVPKTYSYRYEVNGDTGPAGEPLVHAGAAIIEGRYRGRAATWNIARSIVENGNKLPDRARVLAAVAKTDGLSTPIGKIGFDANGDVREPVLSLYAIKDGKSIFVDQINIKGR